MLENAAIGTAVGITAFANDADGTDTVSYSLDDDAGGRFSIDANTGVVTVAGGIDREAAASYNITVRATTTDTLHDHAVFTITIGDVDEFDVGAVTDTDAAANTVDENAVVGTTVGITASASDADATTNAITYIARRRCRRPVRDRRQHGRRDRGRRDRPRGGQPRYDITVRATSSRRLVQHDQTLHDHRQRRGRVRRRRGHRHATPRPTRWPRTPSSAPRWA